MIKINQNPMTVIFFTPHADDIELGTPFMYLEALKLNNRVIEVVMTNNEFGTQRNEFKGKRIRKIREKELDNANLIFERATNNKVEVIRMGYVDGHLPVNKESIQKISELILKEQPTIIFAPDFWYAQDFHPDHINTGRLIFFSLKKLQKSKLPKKVFYYYSTKTRLYLNCNWNEFRIIEEALSQHKSQYSPFENKLIITFYNKLSMLRHFFERKRFSESFREQEFKDGVPIPPKKFKKLSLRKRIIYYTFSKVTLWGCKKFYNLDFKTLYKKNEN